MAKQNNTKVVTGIVRLSYANIWDPKAPVSGGDPRYSCSLIIPKSDTETVDAMKLPLRDGDLEREDDAYKGCWFINANSKTAPQVVDRHVQPIIDRSEIYSGVYARVSISLYAFSVNGNRGVACGLGNIQKIRDGEPLGGHTNASNDFDAVDDGDEDFLN